MLRYDYGNWKFDPGTEVLIYREGQRAQYFFSLAYLQNSASILDRIFEVTETRTWTSADIGDLVRLILFLIGRKVAFGRIDNPIDPNAVARENIRSREAALERLAESRVTACLVDGCPRSRPLIS